MPTEGGVHPFGRSLKLRFMHCFLLTADGMWGKDPSRPLPGQCVCVLEALHFVTSTAVKARPVWRGCATKMSFARTASSVYGPQSEASTKVGAVVCAWRVSSSLELWKRSSRSFTPCDRTLAPWQTTDDNRLVALQRFVRAAVSTSGSAARRPARESRVSVVPPVARAVGQTGVRRRREGTTPRISRQPAAPVQ